MTRLGKIARLPREIREELNVRLRDGGTGKHLVEWLNGLPKTREILSAQFGGRPINEQNMTEWKQGGYEDWLHHQENCAQARILIENSMDIAKEAGGVRLEDRLAALTALALARLVQEADKSPSSPEKQKTLLSVAHELTLLRRGSHDADRARIECERWEAEQAETNEEKRKAAENAAFLQRFYVEHPEFSNGLLKIPDQDLQTCLEASSRLRRERNEQSNLKSAVKEAQSNQIKPNQAESNL